MTCGVVATSISGCDVCTLCRAVCDLGRKLHGRERFGFPISEVARQTQKPNTFCAYTSEVPTSNFCILFSYLCFNLPHVSLSHCKQTTTTSL